MKSTGLVTLITSLMLGIGSPLALAQEGGGGLASDGYVGLMIGMADPTNIEGRMAFGASAGMQFYNNITGSVFYLMSKAEEGSGVDVTLTHFGLGADYDLSEMAMAGLHAGLRAGMGSIDIEDGDSESSFIFGPAIGYDYQVAPYLSLGAEASVLWDSGGDVENTLYAMANIKYWF